MSEQAGPEPLLRVVKGHLDQEELAALVVVVAAHAAATADVASGPTPRSQWGHPRLAARAPHSFGPDGWRRSALGR